MSLSKKLLQLITNESSQRLSTSDTLIVAAFVASTFTLIYCTFKGELTEWLYIGYLGAWVAQSQASKQAAIKRSREVNLSE